MSDTDARIGKRLAKLRGDMSQASLAAAMAERGHKWSQATVWAVESAKRPLRLAEAEDVSEILGATVPELLKSDDIDAAARAVYGELAEVARATEEFERSAQEVMRYRERAEDALAALGMIAEADGGLRGRARYGLVQKDYEYEVSRTLPQILSDLEAKWRADLERYDDNGVDQ